MARKRMIGWKSLIIFLNDFSSIVYLIPYLACDFYNQFKISYGVTNGQLGWLLTAFAASAVPCYFFSGWIMDIFDAKNLIAASCYSTAAVAVGVAFCRSFPVLVILFFLFGIASITFNWSAYLKTVKIIGDDDEQGRLFAITDIGYSAFSLLAQYVVIYVVMIVYSGRSDGFRYAYIIYAVLSVLIGICIQITFPSVERTAKVSGSFRRNLTSIGHAVTYRLPWLIGAFTLGYYIVRSTATYINVYLYNVSGISLVGSQFFTSTSRMVTLLIFSPIGGWVHDKMGQKAAKYISWSAGGIIALFYL
jgi:MFS family permease